MKSLFYWTDYVGPPNRVTNWTYNGSHIFSTWYNLIVTRVGFCPFLITRLAIDHSKIAVRSRRVSKTPIQSIWSLRPLSKLQQSSHKISTFVSLWTFTLSSSLLEIEECLESNKVDQKVLESHHLCSVSRISLDYVSGDNGAFTTILDIGRMVISLSAFTPHVCHVIRRALVMVTRVICRMVMCIHW